MYEVKKERETEEGAKNGRRRKTSYLGSTISNNSESVVRSQTSYAFVVLNSDIQSGLKSSIEFASPPVIHPPIGSASPRKEEKKKERTYQTHQ